MASLARILTLALLLLPLVGRGQGLTLEVRTVGLPPEQVRLCQIVADATLTVDSAWMDAKGVYHLKVPKAEASLYQLKISGAEPLPLLLMGATGRVTVEWVNPDALRLSKVEGAPGGTAYLRASAHREAIDRLGYAMTLLKDALDSRDSGSVGQLESLRALARREGEALGRLILETPGLTDECRAALSLVGAQMAAAHPAWWVGRWKGYEPFSEGKALRGHLATFLDAQGDESLTRAAQEDRFKGAVDRLALLFGGTPLEESIRSGCASFFGSLGLLNLRSYAIARFSNPEAKLESAVANMPVERLGLRDMKGKKVPLPCGGGTLVVVWSIWCSHCQEMLPALSRWYEALRARKEPAPRLLALCIEPNEGVVRDYVRTLKYAFPIVFSERDPFEILPLSGTPAFIRLNADGRPIAAPLTLEQVEAEYW